jgi:hypothetical protein
MMARDWRVDALRGYFLVIMTLAHLPPYPLERFTGYTFGFASAPDGFVFLSGLMSAWVYLRVRNKRGQLAMEARVLRRTRDIYLVHILLLSAGILGAVFFKQTSFQTAHPVQAFLAGSVLLYRPIFCDILPMYCIFLLFTPIVLDQMMKGRAWLVCTISAALWLTAQRGIGDPSHLVPWIDVGVFNILAWQAYFIAGQYLGHRQLRSGDGVVSRSRVLLALCIVLSVFFFVERHPHLMFGMTPWLKFSGPDRNPVRFLNAACLGYVIWWFPRAIDQRLMKLRLFKFFNLLGRHSLQVFAFSLLICTPLWEAPSHFWAGMPGSAKVVVALVTVLSLAIPARLHQMYRERRLEKPGPIVEPAILRASPNFVVRTSSEPA